MESPLQCHNQVLTKLTGNYIQFSVNSWRGVTDQWGGNMMSFALKFVWLSLTFMGIYETSTIDAAVES